MCIRDRYARGRGVERNHAWAVFWFTTATRGGNDVARENIQSSLAHLQQGQIVANRVNIRSGAGTQHTPLTQLEQGETVYVLGAMDDWSQVYFENNGEPQLGWIASSLLQ